MTGVTLDSRAVLPGDLYAALPGARAHGADFAGQAAAAGAVAVLTDREGVDRMTAAGVALPAVVVEHPRAVLGAVCGARARHRAPRAAPGRHHRHQRQDHDRLPRALRPDRPGPAARADRHGRDADRRRAARQRAHHPRGARAARRAGRDGRAGPGHLRHGGLQPRAGAAPGRRGGLRRGAVHEPVAGPPRLPPRHGRLLRRQGLAVHPRTGPPGLVCVDDAWGRRLAQRAGIPVTTIGAADGRGLADRGRRQRPGGVPAHRAAGSTST